MILITPIDILLAVGAFIAVCYLAAGAFIIAAIIISMRR